MAITAKMRSDVSNLYVALFGRAPDGEGLGFWVGKLDAGQSIESVAQQMYDTTPARVLYPSFLTNQEIISKFYTNVLGRPAGTDASGIAFWTAKLDAGQTKGSVIVQMLSVVTNYTGTDAAGLDSASLFANKGAVALAYGLANGNIDNATSILSGVTKDAATKDAAIAQINAGFGSGTAGTTYNLSANVETTNGTSGDDTFNGTTTNTGQTLNTGDIINGAAGNDTLKITAQGATALFQTNSVETIDVRMLSAQAFDAVGWASVGTVNLNNESINGNALTITNANQATTFKISDQGTLSASYLCEWHQRYREACSGRCGCEGCVCLAVHSCCHREHCDDRVWH